MKSLVFWVLLGFFSIFAALGIGELFMRVAYPTPWYGYTYSPPQEGLFRYDSLLGWSGKPNSQGLFAATDFYHQVSHDAFGFRNSNKPYVASKKNILVLGDSYGWGWGVKDEEVFPQVMMRADKSLNIYNLSAPGYGTDQEYLALNRFLSDHPDIQIDGIILLTYKNDFYEVDKDVMYNYPKPRYILNDANALTLTNVPVPDSKAHEFEREREPPQKRSRFLNNFYIYNLINRFVDLEKLKEAHLDEYRNLPPTETVVTEISGKRLDIITHLLDRIHGIAKQNDAFFHVVTIFAGDDLKFVEMRKRLEGMGIRYTNYERSAVPLNELWIDHHLNAYGHKSLADRLLSDIAEYGYIGTD